VGAPAGVRGEAGAPRVTAPGACRRCTTSDHDHAIIPSAHDRHTRMRTSPGTGVIAAHKAPRATVRGGRDLCEGRDEMRFLFVPRAGRGQRLGKRSPLQLIRIAIRVPRHGIAGLSSSERDQPTIGCALHDSAAGCSVMREMRYSASTGPAG
jgi:hypothetical protein